MRKPEFTYLPFLSGVYSTAPGLIAMEKATRKEDQLVFQVDDTYANYISNKLQCREENIHKYYAEKDLYSETCTAVNNYLVQQLLQEYPSIFEFRKTQSSCSLTNTLTNEIITWNNEDKLLTNAPYASLFDALCSQVQEDICICQMEGENDWLSAIHLCAPNHWAPGEKIGKPFLTIHAPVPGMEKTKSNYLKLLLSSVNRGPFTRFAWGVATDKRLNHHPVPPPGKTIEEWQGRDFGKEDKLYIRTERQNIIGFPGASAFMFTIRTFFYDVDDLSPDENKALLKAISSMTADSLAYKGMTNVTSTLTQGLKL